MGPAMPCIELRLEGVPEMKYDSNASPPRGEVCLRGPSLFSGYYKDATKTAEDVDAEGWFHTGAPQTLRQHADALTQFEAMPLTGPEAIVP